MHTLVNIIYLTRQFIFTKLKLQVVDQIFKVLDEKEKLERKKSKTKFNVDDLQQKKKTTIILSRDLIERIAELGRKGETYDNIINRIIDYDISLSRKAGEYPKDSPIYKMKTS